MICYADDDYEFRVLVGARITQSFQRRQARIISSTASASSGFAEHVSSFRGFFCKAELYMAPQKITTLPSAPS